MKIFLAGATGVIGRKLVSLLRAAGHNVAGTTRSAAKADVIAGLGAEPVVIDVFDAAGLTQTVCNAAPDIVIHQLTDLPFAPGSPQFEEGLARNARLRDEGTRNLVSATRAAGVRRLIAQSIAFVYAPGNTTRIESDPLNTSAPGLAGRTVAAVMALEKEVLAVPEGIILRYGFFYGPDTWFPAKPALQPAVHVDAAAQVALQAVSKGRPGIYNIAEDEPSLSSDKAKRLLGFDPDFRVTP